MSAVKAGDIVRIRYTTRTEDGAVYETTGSRKPLEFTAGSDELIAGLSHAVVGMSEGDKKTVTVQPEDAFGSRDAGLERNVPRFCLPEHVEEGDQLTATFANRKLDVWVQKSHDEHAVIDANHPLAGETLVYDIELVSFDAK